MNTYNFTKAPFGMLVKHSPHYLKNRCVKGKERRKIGLMVGRKFYEDKIVGVVCWPVVHWEGEVMEHSCHPVNVEPYRKSHRKQLGKIKIEE
jgi:hypothetical protein